MPGSILEICGSYTIECEGRVGDIQERECTDRTEAIEQEDRSQYKSLES